MSRTTFFTTAIAMLAAAASCAAQLDDLARVLDRDTRRASSHDRSGGNNDFIDGLAPKSVHTLLDVDGPGRITHLWFTAAKFPNHDTFLRDLVLRIFWEGSPVPSVEVPLGDFFALGHARWYRVASLPVAVGANPTAMNCYWPMPFYRHARVELVNNGSRSVRKVYYNIDYELGPIAAGQALFHAQFRKQQLRSQPEKGNTTGADNFVILDTDGRGQYVGCVLSVDAEPGGWWGEGDDMIFIDHSQEPVIIGTGSEDYFCNAWGYQEAFCQPFYGAPLVEKTPDGGGLTTVYRWHIADPVRFRKHIRVTIEHTFDPRVTNEYSSVAYWYQTDPICAREPLPPAEANHPRARAGEVNATELEPLLNARGIQAAVVTTPLDAGFEKGGWLRITLPADTVAVGVPVARSGTYRVQLKVVNELIDGEIRAGLQPADMKRIEKAARHQREIPYVDLGAARSAGGELTIHLSGNKVIGLDCIRLQRVGD